jgi:DUF177 domain-containing protein
LKINISNLSEGVHEYQFEESPSSIKLDERFSKPVFVQVEIEKRRRQLFLTGHIKTVGRFVCDRCLDEFDNHIDADYRMTYVYDASDAGEIDKDELTVIHTSTNEIKIDDDVREYILLAIPFKLLCKEDCAGLCGTCGANHNHETCDCSAEKTDFVQDKQKKTVNNN